MDSNAAVVFVNKTDTIKVCVTPYVFPYVFSYTGIGQHSACGKMSNGME